MFRIAPKLFLASCFFIGLVVRCRMDSQSSHSTLSLILSEQTFKYLEQDQLPYSWFQNSGENQCLTKLKSKNVRKTYLEDEHKDYQPDQKELKHSSTGIVLDLSKNGVHKAILDSQSSTSSSITSQQCLKHIQSPEQLPEIWFQNSDENLSLTTLKSKNVGKTEDKHKDDQPNSDLSNIGVQKAIKECLPLNCNVNFPSSERVLGKHNFDVIFREAIKETKHICYTYSEILDTLFVRPDIPCYAIFNWVGEFPAGTRLFITPMFLMSHHANDPVRACPNHMNDKPNTSASRHLIRIERECVVYGVHHNSEHHYVSVGCHEVAKGKNRFDIPIRFLCYSTCLGGIGRRPFQVIYWMQHKDEILGRKSIKTVVCSSPGRDKRNREMERSGRRIVDSKPKNKRSHLNTEKDNNENSGLEVSKVEGSCLSVKARDQKEYKLLIKYRTHLREHSGISCKCTFLSH